MSIILGSQAQKPGLGKEKYAPRPAQGRKTGLEMEKYAARPGNENYVNHFGQSSPENGSRKRKIRFQTRPRKKTGSRECENKQLDPGMEIMSIILNSQVRKTGLGKEKYAPRPAQGREPGLERKNILPDP